MHQTTIVIVEDNEAIAKLVQELVIEEMSCEALVAGDGIGGLEMIRKIRPNLVILDIGLPGLDGFQVYDFLQQNHHLRFIPVLFLTASDYPDSFYLRRGIRHHLRKPFDLDDLLNHVERLIDPGPISYEPGIADSAVTPLA